jgi:hypothetical protein
MKSDLEIENAASLPLRGSLAGHNPVWHPRNFQTISAPTADGIHRPEKFAEDMFALLTVGHFGALQNCRMGRRLPRKSHCSMSLSPDSPGLRHAPGIVLPSEATHRQEVRPGLGAGPLIAGSGRGIVQR